MFTDPSGPQPLRCEDMKSYDTKALARRAADILRSKSGNRTRYDTYACPGGNHYHYLAISPSRSHAVARSRSRRRSMRFTEEAAA